MLVHRTHIPSVFLFPPPSASTLSGQKNSVYSIAMNDSGTVLVCGGTEKVCIYSTYVQYICTVHVLACTAYTYTCTCAVRVQMTLIPCPPSLHSGTGVAGLGSSY